MTDPLTLSQAKEALTSLIFLANDLLDDLTADLTPDEDEISWNPNYPLSEWLEGQAPGGAILTDAFTAEQLTDLLTKIHINQQANS